MKSTLLVKKELLVTRKLVWCRRPVKRVQLVTRKLVWCRQQVKKGLPVMSKLGKMVRLVMSKLGKMVQLEMNKQVLYKPLVKTVQLARRIPTWYAQLVRNKLVSSILQVKSILM